MNAGIAHPRTAVIAALPREVRGLLGGASPDPALKSRGVFLYRLENAIVVAAGMGSARVALALQAALAGDRIAEVISTGLAGACTSALAGGSIAEAARVIDAQTGERFRTDDPGGGVVLVTAGAIASAQEKARLAATYGAAMVDMEAGTLARLAQARGLRFRAIKGISDAQDFELEGLSRFTGARGEFRTAAFAMYTAWRPSTWASAAKLGRESNRALKALTERLREVLAQPT